MSVSGNSQLALLQTIKSSAGSGDSVGGRVISNEYRFEGSPSGSVNVKTRGTPPGAGVFSEVGYSVRDPERLFKLDQFKVLDLAVQEIETRVRINSAVVGIRFGRLEYGC